MKLHQKQNPKQNTLEPITNRQSNNDENGEKNKKLKQFLVDEENNLTIFNIKIMI